MSEKPVPTFVMVPRKLVIAWVITTALLFTMILLSFQYADYVDRRSNQRWCGLVGLFNESYAERPPETDLGKKIATAMAELPKSFECK